MTLCVGNKFAAEGSHPICFGVGVCEKRNAKGGVQLQASRSRLEGECLLTLSMDTIAVRPCALAERGSSMMRATSIGFKKNVRNFTHDDNS